MLGDKGMRTMFAALAMAAALIAQPLGAAEYRAGDMVVTQPWARASAGAGRAGAAYVTLHNRGGQADRLMGVSTPVAGHAALHGHRMQGNVMRMYSHGPLAVPAGKAVTLRPGGLHIMLMGLKERLNKGATFPMTLSFEKAGAVEVQVSVHGLGGMGGMKSGMGSGGHK